MARASYIYLVPRWGTDQTEARDLCRDVLAAFTVKHEAVSFCQRNELPTSLFRLPDGRSEQGVWIEGRSHGA